MKKLSTVTAEKGTVRERVLLDARSRDEEEAMVYLQDIASHGCIGGSCDGLISYFETEAFYTKYAHDIDAILERLGEEMGEPYNILENMERLHLTENLRNFLSWLAYEVEAQAIVSEVSEG